MSPFLQYALLAGTAVAVAAGLVGYLLVVRGQVFTADALSHVAFTGAGAALAAGLAPGVGLFAGTVVVALGLGLAGRRGHPDDVVTGGVFAWVLGLGALFLTVYTRHGTGNGAATASVLFGSVFGLSARRAVIAAAVAGGVAVVIALLARPLLFASLDPGVARSRGVPVRRLGLAFLVLVAIVVAEASQVVGALLVLGLLAAPAGAAIQLTARPMLALAVSTGLAVASVWLGLAASVAVPVLPPSFTILASATAGYLAASGYRAARSQPRPR